MAITDLLIFTRLFLIAFITHPISSIRSFKEINVDYEPKFEQRPQQIGQAESLYDQMNRLHRYNWSL